MAKRTNMTLVGGLLIIIVLAIAVGFGLASRSNDQPDNVQGYFDDLKKACDKVAPSYIGLSQGQAEAQANHAQRTYRIISVDGKGGAITDDFSPSRLNFVVNHRQVTKAECY